MEKLEIANKGGNQSQAFKKVIDSEWTRIETGQRSGNIHVLTQLKQFKRVPDDASDELIGKLFKILYEQMPKYYSDSTQK